MRYRIDLSYNGSTFCGWQIQPDAPSVQGTLESALKVLLKEEIAVTGAGRTDTGVHASMYVAHFDCETPFNPGDIRYKLNAILPDGIAINGISEAAPDFHSRFDARRREYTYFLHRAKNPFLDGTSYWFGYPNVDFDAMNRAATVLLGTHDFSCFEKSGGDNKTSICTVFEAAWHQYTPEFLSSSGPETLMCGDYWYFRISADRFLRNMVRAIVGTLLEVGRGRRTEDDFATLILPPEQSLSSGPGASKRSKAGESVPGHALFLSAIDY